MPGMFRTKSVEQSIRDTDDPDHKLRKNLSAMDLVVFGVGVVIGTGIFVLTGQQAALNAGPAIVFSFIIAAVVCGLAAMCYAEFASTVPVAGSAYTFSYATLGELVAWIIGWDLALELALGAAVVSRGWSSYLQSLLNLPDTLFGDKAAVDLGAVMIVIALSIVAVVGIKLSSRLLSVLVAIKVAVVLLVIVVGFFYIKAANYSPFVPDAVTQTLGDVDALKTPLLQVFTGEQTAFGVAGIIAAASVVFFSFIGFDIVATSAEETRNPQKDLPRGILGSLVVCTILYVLVSFVITGMVKYNATGPDGELKLNTAAPLADAFTEVGADWAATLIALGGVIGITTVILVLLLGQTRVLFAMSRDGLLPRSLAKVNPKFGTPARIQIGTGVVVAILAALVPLAELSQLVSIGTLFAFIVVSIGVIVLRRTRPDLPRSFRTPGVPVVPILSVLACLYLILNLPLESILRFLVWMILGAALYFVYGHRNSRLARASREGAPPAQDTGPTDRT
ncbi:amino acid permease [Epidermidibacterium keratini]